MLFSLNKVSEVPWFLKKTMNECWSNYYFHIALPRADKKKVEKKYPKPKPGGLKLVGCLPDYSGNLGYFCTDSIELPSDLITSIHDEINNDDSLLISYGFDIDLLLSKQDGKLSYGAVFCGKDLSYQHEGYPFSDIKEYPWLIYVLGCDDGSIGLRFKTEKLMKEKLSTLRHMNDIYDDKNLLTYN